MVKGIDVAKWNDMIDWGRVKAAGIEFVILKVINKQCREEDSFSRNYAGASAKGLSIGVYNYSYAVTVEMAQNAARKVLQVLSGKKLQCRVWLDVEDKCQQGIGHKLIDIIKAYQKIIEAAGYEFGVYTGLYFYNTYLKPYAAELDCKFWIARYPSGANVAVSYDPPASKKPAIIMPCGDGSTAALDRCLELPGMWIWTCIMERLLYHILFSGKEVVALMFGSCRRSLTA